MHDSKHKPSVDDLIDSAFEAVDRRQLDVAEDLCRQILAGEPKHFDATMLLGVLASESGRTELGITLLQDAIALQPQSVEAHLQLGGLLRAEGRLSEAISVLEGAVRLEPNGFTSHDLGVIYLESNRLPEAVACFERAIKLNPDLANTHYLLGTVLELQGRDAEAINPYRQAVALDPNHAVAQERLGNLLYAQGSLAEAVSCFQRAVAANPDSTTGRRSLARALFDDSRLAEAEECLNRAIALDPTSGELHWLLGNALKQLGRFDKAIVCFERAIALDTYGVASYYALANAKKFTEADRPLVEQMAALLNNDALDDEKRIPLHFALGKAFDDLGQYQDAIRHYDSGNRMRHRVSHFDRERFSGFIDQSIAVFTKDFISRSAAAGSQSKLPILIVGMARSGTTLVEQIISNHPDVGAGGELAFWSDAMAGIDRIELAGLDPDLAQRLAGDYLALLEQIAPQAKRVTDKMPENFRFVWLIHAVFPKARIIHCRRHPVDTGLSIYFTLFNQGSDFAYYRDDIVFYYSQYARLMAHWRKVIPPECFLEVDYEDLIADRERVTRKLIDFCDLDWNDTCLRHEDNRRMVKTASLWQARQPIYKSSVGRWRNYEPWLGELGRLLPGATD